MSPHPFQCRCGTLRGELLRPARTLHAVCYCRDCQTYAHALGVAQRTLDAHGGTEVVSTQARYVRLTEGADALACLSLTERGLLRWYASCCRTPVCNTTRDMRLSYVGVLHTCLTTTEADLTASFGPIRMRVNMRHAKGEVPRPGIGQFAALLRIAPGLVWDRVSGGWRKTPFFDTVHGRPLAEPRVLTAAELQEARHAV